VQIKVVQETILNGFEKMPEALIGLFNSTAGNLGKVIVKAYPD
jgi:NADPH-dependent curcumin reductase CurA